MKVIYEEFKSITHILDTMENRPLNKVFSILETPSSQRDESNKTVKFSGVDTYNEGIEIMQAGYRSPLEKIKKAVLKIGQTDTYKRPRMKNDYIGFAANVPNTLMNLPITMINREKVQYKQKNIHLIYSFCALSDVTTEEIIKAGINFISLVNSLEKQGYRVKIDTIFGSHAGNTAALFTVNLKQYEQSLNMLKLTFPLVHPAMLRRISFKWLETLPDLKEKSYCHGYGTVLRVALGNNIDKERDFLKTNNIIKNENSYYIDVYQAFKANNVEELANSAGLNK